MNRNQDSVFMHKWNIRIVTHNQCSKVRYGRSRSWKVVDFGGNRQRLGTVLLSRTVSEIRRLNCWLQIAHFPHPSPISRFLSGWPLAIFWKSVRILKVESFTELTVKMSWSELASFWQGSRVWQTDGRTDDTGICIAAMPTTCKILKLKY